MLEAGVAHGAVDHHDLVVADAVGGAFLAEDADEAAEGVGGVVVDEGQSDLGCSGPLLRRWPTAEAMMPRAQVAASSGRSVRVTLPFSVTWTVPRWVLPWSVTVTSAVKPGNWLNSAGLAGVGEELGGVGIGPGGVVGEGVGGEGGEDHARVRGVSCQTPGWEGMGREYPGGGGIATEIWEWYQAPL